MLKRLGSAAVLSVSFSLAAVAPASASSSCGILGVLSACPPPASPAPAAAPPAAPSPSSAAPVAPPDAAATGLAEGSASPQAQAGLGIAEVPGAAAVLFQLVNQERAAANLPLLESRAAIGEVAAGQSRAMAARGDIWHNDAYFTENTRSALSAARLGENVAMNGSVEDAHRRLMASPGHRANILNGRFDAVGVSVVHDDHGSLFITQDFVDSKVAPRATSTRRARARAASHRTRSSSRVRRVRR